MTINKDVCVSCGACADACPVGAISQGADAYEIDQDVCVGCGACQGTCPIVAGGWWFPPWKGLGWGNTLGPHSGA